MEYKRIRAGVSPFLSGPDRGHPFRLLRQTYKELVMHRKPLGFGYSKRQKLPVCLVGLRNPCKHRVQSPTQAWRNDPDGLS